MKDDLTYIENCARKATKGQWIAVGSWVENTKDNRPDIVCTPHDFDRGPRDSPKQRERDALYIAAAQPKAIMTLISQLRLTRAALTKARTGLSRACY